MLEFTNENKKAPVRYMTEAFSVMRVCFFSQ